MRSPNGQVLGNVGREYVCVEGSIWALTYSECAPPDQRTYWGCCRYCNRPAPVEPLESFTEIPEPR